MDRELVTRCCGFCRRVLSLVEGFYLRKRYIPGEDIGLLEKQRESENEKDWRGRGSVLEGEWTLVLVEAMSGLQLR